MNRIRLIELIRGGETSSVEFKRDDIPPEKLAELIVALLNLRGGYILLGIEDGGSISGLTRKPSEAEEWVMQVARDHVRPEVIPYWDTFELEGRMIGLITLPANAANKPYKAKRKSVWLTLVRVGTTIRQASREEEERLYQQSGRLRYGLKPVPGTTWESLDFRRLQDYYTRLLSGDVPAPTDIERWQRELLNLELMVRIEDQVAVTVDGILLFGRNPGRFVPQSGIRAICYPGEEPDYAVRADEYIKGPLVPLYSNELVVESGIVDQAWDFVRRNISPHSWLEDAQRYEDWDYPEEVVREVIVNALIHRDYSISGTDVTLQIFSDRLEVHSPGKLPNTLTIESVKSGMRYARNQVLVNIMRDYGYVDARGMGIRSKVIPRMLEHNGTEPDFIEDENLFVVCLRKVS